MMLPTELSDAVSKRLTMFRFRSRVEFELEPATAADLGSDVDYDSWSAQQIRAGVAQIAAAQTEKFTPHMLNLDLLGGVSFNKGCYTGQEVVARTHYKGATKRRVLRFGVDNAAKPGDKLTLNGREVGEVVNAVAGEILAVAPVDDRNAGLKLGEQELRPLPLPYLDGS
jgi:folate-binding protein YgfZ